MLKIICLALIVIFSFLSISAAAPTPQDERRIEEQKRADLKNTQTAPSPTETADSASPLQPDDMIYLVDMSLRKITYGYDLCKLIVILKGVDEQYIGLDVQAQYLKDQGYLPEDETERFDPMQPLKRGLAAYALIRALEIKGGIFLTLFRESRRYALKELAYEGIMSSGNINEIISGDELTAAFMRAINYRQKPTP